MKIATVLKLLAVAPAALAALPAAAAHRGPAPCAGLAAALAVTNSPLTLHQKLKQALDMAVTEEQSGLDFEMWGALVDRDGTVCAVAFSGDDRGSQWPGSRAIAAQKAYTANAFSLDGLALSTANLYSAVQPGGSLYGLQHSNPVDPAAAYMGPATAFGQASDPMVGARVGGVNVFGGGLGLYAASKIVGAVGVSGDTSCADHNIGWRVRNHLGLDQMVGVGGVANPAGGFPDDIIYDIIENPNGGTGKSAGGFGHPTCLNTDTPPPNLPPVQH